MGLRKVEKMAENLVEYSVVNSADLLEWMLAAQWAGRLVENSVAWLVDYWAVKKVEWRVG